MKQAVAVLGCGVLALTASACESTESESAKIARPQKSHGSTGGTIGLGGANHDVRISHVSFLRDAGRAAVAVQLTGTSHTAQRNVPVLVNLTANSGKVLYTNDTEGLESALQRMPLLLPGRSEWWVDDQVLTNQSVAAVQVRVGRSSGEGAKPSGEISVSAVRLGKRSGLTVLEGKLSNRSRASQENLPVFAVALKRGKVVAAGRAVIKILSAGASSVPFEIFLIGDATGASTQLTVALTAR